MHRGWIKDWRKSEDGPIWSMPPLYFKVWRWILYKTDRKTGILKTSINRIAEGVEWQDRECTRTPNKATILRILDWLQEQNMVSRATGGKGNAQYTKLTIIKWDTYQSKDDIEVTLNDLKNDLKNDYSTRSTENLEEVPQIQDQRITAPQKRGVAGELGDALIGMGMKNERQTFSWIGGLVKSYGEAVCRKMVTESITKGLSPSDFRDSTKDMKAYMTAIVKNEAAGKASNNGRAVVFCPKCHKASHLRDDSADVYRCDPCQYSWKVTAQ